MIIQTPNRGNIENKTNCVTHIPQDIKLTLVNGVLTLKAGSKVYIPDGFESDGTTPKFDVISISSDLSIGQSSTFTGTGVYYYESESAALTYISINTIYSGTTDPGNNSLWYDTTNNNIRRKTSTGTEINSCSFPIAIAEVNNGSPISIKQVFNGCGYIGNTHFLLPGIKYICADGFDKKGDNNNKEFTISTVIIKIIPPNVTFNNHKFYYIARENQSANTFLDIQVSIGALPTSTFSGWNFNIAENKWFWYENGVRGIQAYPVIISSFLVISTASVLTISNFNAPKVFQPKNEESIIEDYSLQETYTGKHWIDGKKIYRRVTTITGPTVSTDGTFVQNQNALADWNISQPISFIALTGSITLPRMWNSYRLSAGMYLNGSTWGVEVSCNRTGYSNAQITCIIEYTKTTD